MRQLAVAIGVALALGCVARAEETARRPMRELLVKAGDFQFTSPDTVEAGYIRLRMESTGKELHHLRLLRLEHGITREDVLQHARRNELVFPGLTFADGTDVPGPGRSSEVVLDLRPGRYLMVCYMTTGLVKHLLMGMTRELTVLPSEGPGATPPQEDERMVLRSYWYEVDSPPGPGRG